MSLIEIKNINKIYGDKDNEFCALKNVNLKIDKGEMIAIIGPSGSGKSTLLNILGCIDTPSDGEYFLNGKLVNQQKPKQLAKIRNESFGFVFQNFSLLNEYTILENVELPLIYRNNLEKIKLSKKEIREKALKAIETVGLTSHIKKTPNKLSGGQQQRIAIARALIGNSPILLADEPTGALDQKTGQELLKILKDLNEQGKTIIIITHDEKVAKECQRTLKIVDGEIAS